MSAGGYSGEYVPYAAVMAEIERELRGSERSLRTLCLDVDARFGCLPGATLHRLGVARRTGRMTLRIADRLLIVAHCQGALHALLEDAA